ncbi:MAG: DUF1801 domain-containing protein [Leeuwenhoekiella sp.]
MKAKTYKDRSCLSHSLQVDQQIFSLQFKIFYILETRNPKPETRNPKPETRNPKPETRNPKPETRNPKPETHVNPAENYMLSKPEPWRSILIELREIIKQTVPEVQEGYKWSLPFYTLDGRMFCYLNFRKSFVDISFLYGNALTHHTEHLVAGEGRKMVHSLRFFALSEINHEVIQDLLLEQQENVRHKKRA